MASPFSGRKLKGQGHVHGGPVEISNQRQFGSEF